MKTKLLMIFISIWNILTHRITIYTTVIGSCVAIGYIIGTAWRKGGPPEQHLSGVGICLTIITVAFALGYIRDCIDMFKEESDEL